MSKKRVAIIPARGGSKRLKNKNILDFCGKPMIVWTIEAALKSECFDKVIVSTDDKEIAEIALKNGAEVPFFRDRGADDYTPVSSVTIDTICRLENELGKHYQVVVQLLANCPLRGSKAIYDMCSFFEENNLDYLLSATKYNWLNPWWAHRLKDENIADPVFKEALSQRSQDLDELYCPTGAVWIADIAKLKESETFYGPGYRFYGLDWKESVDIDDIDDMEFGIGVFEMLKKK